MKGIVLALVVVIFIGSFSSVHNASKPVRFAGAAARSPKEGGLMIVDGVRFLVAVNDTWDPNGCIYTIATDFIPPNLKWNQSERIQVGTCDSGPLTYHVTPQTNGNVTIDLTFYSSVIEDASPPTCQITWNGVYLTPSYIPQYDATKLESLLPGCFTMESREGYHMTSYWFQILEWRLS